MSTLSQNPNRLNVQPGELVSGVLDGKPFIGPVWSTDDGGLNVSIDMRQRRIPWTTLELQRVDDGAPLTLDEKSRLFHLEQVVSRGLQTFFDVGNALAEIQELRLYRTSHRNFAEYLSDKWGISPSKGFRQIAAARIVGEMSPNGDKPQTEAQVRPLSKLATPEQRDQAWSLAQEQSGTDQPTARAVAAAVQQIIAPVPPPAPPAPPVLTRRTDEEIWWTDPATGNLRQGVIAGNYADGYIARPTDGGREGEIYVRDESIGEGEIPREPAPFGLCAGCHVILKQPFHVTPTGRKCATCHQEEPERPFVTTVTPPPLSAPQISEEECLEEHAQAQRWMQLETVFEHVSELLFEAVTAAHELGEPQREMAGLILRLAPADDPEWTELREWADAEMTGGAA